MPVYLCQTDECSAVHEEHTELVDDVLIDRGDCPLELVEDTADDAGADHAQEEHGDNAEVVHVHVSSGAL